MTTTRILLVNFSKNTKIYDKILVNDIIGLHRLFLSLMTVLKDGSYYASKESVQLRGRPRNTGIRK